MHVKLGELEKTKFRPILRDAHIKSVNFWESMVMFSQHHLRKV